MARIKVTGYLEIDPDEEDPNHEMGMTEEAYMRYSADLGLDEIEFERAD